MQAFGCRYTGDAQSDLVLRGPLHPEVVAMVCKTSDFLGLPIVADTNDRRLRAFDDFYELRGTTPGQSITR
jgi:hypothetical protein